MRIEATLRLPPAVRSAVAEQKPKPLQPKPKPASSAKAGTPRQAIAQAPIPEKRDAPVVAVTSAAPLPEASGPVGEGGQAPVMGGGASAPVAAASAPAPYPSPVSVNPAATQAWPRSGKIRYQVRYGETTEIGQMLMIWSHDGERYTLRTEMKTVGLARMIKRFDGVQQSQGLVGPEGLAPTGFQEDLNGKQSHARFDWGVRKVQLSRPDGTQERAMPVDGAQDILSLAHHLAFQSDGAEQIKLYVVAGRWAVPVEVTQVASERLRLPAGVVEARHFHCESNDGQYVIDLWLSREHRNAPIRIRVDDRKQHLVIDEIAQDMALDGVDTHFERTQEEKDLYRG